METVTKHCKLTRCVSTDGTVYTIEFTPDGVWAFISRVIDWEYWRAKPISDIAHTIEWSWQCLTEERAKAALIAMGAPGLGWTSYQVMNWVSDLGRVDRVFGKDQRGHATVERFALSDYHGRTIGLFENMSSALSHIITRGSK